MLWLLCALLGLPAPGGAARILLLAAEPATSPEPTLLARELTRVLREGLGSDYDFHLEHLDLVHFGSPGHCGALMDLLSEKYRERAPDLLVATGPGAARFALAGCARPFPQARLLLEVQPAELVGLELPPGTAAVVSDRAPAAELEQALALLPEVRRAVVIAGGGPGEVLLDPGLQREVARFEERLAVDWWVGLPAAELEERIARLPERTVVLYTGVHGDRAGNSYVSTDVLKRLAASASAPIFSSFAHHLGDGVVGDARYDPAAIGAELGRRAVGMLRGGGGAGAGIHRLPPAPLRFDARQLSRWDIPRRRLPAGSRVELESAPWRLYTGWMVVGIAILVLQSALAAGVVSQASARWRAERKQRRLRDLQAAVFDSMRERVLVLDRSGRILAANRAWDAFVDAHGARALTVGGDFVAAARAAVDRGRDDAHRTVEAIESVLAGAQPSCRVEYVAGDGGDRSWYQMTAVALSSAEGAVVVIDDLTDRHLGEERLGLTLELLPVAAVVLSTDLTILIANGEAQRTFGFSGQELVGRPVDVLVPDGLRDHVAAVLAELEDLEVHSPVRDAELTGRRRDGGTMVLQARARRLRFGDRVTVLCTLHDLTERRQMEREAQLARAEATHFARVATVGEMSAAITHELNQPLTGILSNSQAAMHFLDNGSYDHEDLREALADIVADGRRAREVIQRLRVMLRKGPVEVVPVDVNDIVKQVVRLVAQDLLLRDSALDLELTQDLPHVAADRVSLQQVVLNLVLNGVDAMVQWPADRRHLLVRTAPGVNRTVQIEVQDAGTGISAEVLPHLFEPFFTTKPGGMGMGLSIVRSIVEGYGGRIVAANNRSGGATFTITLPASSAAGEAA